MPLNNFYKDNEIAGICCNAQYVIVFFNRMQISINISFLPTFDLVTFNFILSRKCFSQLPFKVTICSTGDPGFTVVGAFEKTSFLPSVFKNNVKMKMLNPKVLNVGD